MIETQRTFVCVEIPPRNQESIAALQRHFPQNLRCIRWVRPELLHVTMRFLGNLTADEVEVAISAAKVTAREAHPLQVSVGGLGAFPSNRRPRTVWTAIQEGADGLVSLCSSLDVSLSRVGFLVDSHDRFSPHITLGRVRPAAGRAEIRSISNILNSQGTRLQSVTRFQVRGLTVMASELGRDGPNYSPLAVSPFST